MFPGARQHNGASQAIGDVLCDGEGLCLLENWDPPGGTHDPGG